jgi:hypothetical protein
MTTDPFAGLARAMAMDETAWRRHANPWSVWTRIPIGPALILALYARAWIGWWCLVPVAGLAAWTWVNPRAFPPPATLDSWASRGVLGERRLLDRGRRPIPRGHLVAARATAAISLAGLPPAVYGIATLNPWAATLGAALVVCGKLWFVDRMVWLEERMRRVGD